MAANISASVGKSGVNKEGDVKLVQKLLNANYLRKSSGAALLKEDGKIGPKTIAAIERFQKEKVRMSLPDGRIDPDGKTWKALIAPTPVAATPWKMLPDSPYIHRYSEKNAQFGTVDTINSILTLAQKYNALTGQKLRVGDISFANGGLMPKHKSHRSGVDVDIRPVRKDKKLDPVTIQSKDYDHDTTKQLVALVQKDANLKSILFNDKKIMGVTSWEGHDNHLHIRFKK